jgi:DnaJ-class molecular chaperone
MGVTDHDEAASGYQRGAGQGFGSPFGFDHNDIFESIFGRAARGAGGDMGGPQRKTKGDDIQVRLIFFLLRSIILQKKFFFFFVGVFAA